MRTKLELVEDLINGLCERGTYTGLCKLIDCMWKDGEYSCEERVKIRRILMRNKPDFLEHHERLSLYWWEIGKEEPRLEFLTQLQNKLKDEKTSRRIKKIV